MPRGKTPSPAMRPNAVEAKLDLMIQAQHQLVAALTTLVQQMAHPPLVVSATGHEATDMQKEATRGWLEQRVATLQQQTTLGSTSDTMPGMRRVPRGTSKDDPFASGEMPQIDPATPYIDEVQKAADRIGIENPQQFVGGYDPNSLSDMHAELLDELAEAEDDQDILPEPDEDGLWQKRLSMHALRLWQPDWGPRPGQDGCRVPQHLMHNGSAR